jgi:hypothetical protein
MSAVTITPENISATEERGALVQWYQVAVALTIGDAVRLDSSNYANPALATSSAGANAIGLAVFAPNAYGETEVAVGEQVGVVTYGPVYGFTGLVSGQPLYIDKTTAGVLNTAAPTSAYQFILGHAVDDDTFFIDPGTATPVSA